MIPALRRVTLETNVYLPAAIVHFTLANATNQAGLVSQVEQLAANAKTHASLAIHVKPIAEQATRAHKFLELVASIHASAMPQVGSLPIKRNLVNNVLILVQTRKLIPARPTKTRLTNALLCLLTPCLVPALYVNVEGMGFCPLLTLDLALNVRILVQAVTLALVALHQEIDASLIKGDSVDHTHANADNPDG